MNIQYISITDLDNVVKIHNDSFKGFFLTSLGNKFLKTYYTAILKSNKGVLIGISDESGFCGFCAATTLSRGFNKHLVVDNLINFLPLGFYLMIFKPIALLRLIKNFSKTKSNIVDSGNYSELLSIGVSTSKQGFGVGKQLLLRLEIELKNKGCSELSLTTDYYKNEKTIQFYKGLGYIPYYEFVAYPERKMYRMNKKL